MPGSWQAHDFGTCPNGQGTLPGQGVTGARKAAYVGQGKRRWPFSRKVLIKVSTDQLERDEETIYDELLVEEVSIDSMCGVY